MYNATAARADSRVTLGYSYPANHSSWSNSCQSLAEFLKLNYDDWTGYTAVRIVFSVFYSLIFCVSVIGNSWVLVAILRYPQLQTVRNLFILNLSLSDQLVAMFSLPVTAHYIMFKDWILGRYACYIVQILQGMSINISSFTLTMIAVDRYILIVHPMKKPIHKMQATFIILLIWMLAAVVVCPIAVHIVYVPADVLSKRYHFCGYVCKEDWRDSVEARKFYGLCLLIMQYLLPLFIISSCYILIAFKLRRRLRVKKVYVFRKKRPKKDLIAIQKQCRTNKMLISMVALYGLMAAPNTLVNLLVDFNVRVIRNQFYFIGMCTHVIWMTSVIWNPILYGYLNETFRIVFLDFLPFTHKSLEKMALLRSTTAGYSITAEMLRKLSMRMSLRNSVSLEQLSVNSCLNRTTTEGSNEGSN